MQMGIPVDMRQVGHADTFPQACPPLPLRAARARTLV